MTDPCVNTRDFMLNLQAMADAVPDRQLGFFGPGSLAWKINREPILHIAGPRALLMQLAHPLVAKGVVEHSNYEEDLYGRTLRTFNAVYAMIFGTVDEALHWARRVHGVHRRVTGEGYQANDPHLLMWVNATLLDSAVFAYESFVGPLTAKERALHYDEMRIFAAMFGISDDVMPPDVGAFSAYVSDTIASDEIHVTQPAREIAWKLLTGRHFLRVFGPGARIAAAGMLPPKLRDGFGLRWNHRTALAYRALMGTARAGYRRIPSSVRATPAAYEAEQRLNQPQSTQWWSRHARDARQILRKPIQRGFRFLSERV